MSGTAVLVKDHLSGFVGHAALYRVAPPIETFEYVVASSVGAYFGPETYLFGANEDGEIIDWGELPGSMKGDWSHGDVLENAGYVLQATGSAS